MICKIPKIKKNSFIIVHFGSNNILSFANFNTIRTKIIYIFGNKFNKSVCSDG